MTLKISVKDGTGFNGEAAVRDLAERNVPSGLMVYTEPYKQYTPELFFFSNATYGVDMNQNAAFSGTPEGVHNGNDSALWTATAVQGSWTFNSTAQAQSGTRSIDATGTNNNAEARFDDATTTDMTNYIALSGWIYITGWETTGDKNVEIEARLNTVLVGNSVRLSNYINENVFNQWQKFAIPKADLGLSTQTVDELRVRTISGGAGAAPNYYLDNIQWEQTGGPIIFSIRPNVGTRLYLRRIVNFAVSNVDSTFTLTSGSGKTSGSPNISYNKYFGETALTTGLVSVITQNEKIVFASAARQNSDLMQIPDSTMQTGTDGTTTWYKWEADFGTPFVLDGDRGDIWTGTINDDLSTLLQLRAIAIGYSEKIIPPGTIPTTT